MSGPEVCVGGVVVRHGNLLLVRRGRGVAAGSWSVPGGRLEPGETFAEAVERELLEETGLAVRCGALIGWVERTGTDHHFVILDFVADPIDDTPARAGDDAAEVVWVPRAEVATFPGLVSGLGEFLTAHGIIEPGRPVE